MEWDKKEVPLKYLKKQVDLCVMCTSTEPVKLTIKTELFN